MIKIKSKENTPTSMHGVVLRKGQKSPPVFG
jgi:hypothetical protein